eukprot:g13700.t1
METVVFQDMSGKVYKLTLNGDVIWKAGGLNGTWTDGGAALGPNGMVYAVNNNHPPEGLSPVGQMDPPTMPGQVTALDVVTGDIVWQVTTPRPPNNAPAVGKGRIVAGRAPVPTSDQRRPVRCARLQRQDGRVEMGLPWSHAKTPAAGGLQVRAFDTKAAFSGSSSPALAPQMVAVASCDSLFVFKN